MAQQYWFKRFHIKSLARCLGKYLIFTLAMAFNKFLHSSLETSWRAWVSAEAP